jgi:hypothetical protein
MRKKYDIPSEIDFNEWFRDLDNINKSVEYKIEETVK